MYPPTVKEWLYSGYREGENHAQMKFSKKDAIKKICKNINKSCFHGVRGASSSY